MGVNVGPVVAANEAPQFERVVWYKDPGLRRLYLVSCFGLMVASATTGYDGSLLNTVQQFKSWDEYFDHVATDKAQASNLGLLTNMFTIGSIVSMFIVYVRISLTRLCRLANLSPLHTGHLRLTDGAVSLLSLLAAFS
jgi:hypothetical protein